METLNNRTLRYGRHSIYQYMLLVAITLVAAALRFYKLGEWSFWIEEHHTLRHTAALDSIDSLIRSTRPLFYLLNKPITIWGGVNEWSARLVSVLLGVVSVPLLYSLARKLFGSFVALMSALLLALAPWHIYWSQNARFYTLLLLLYTLSLVTFYWGLETDRFRYIAFSFITLALAVASHAIAVLLIPTFLVYGLLLKVLPFEKPPGLRLKNVLPSVVLSLAGYLLYEAILVFYLKATPFINEIYLLFINESTASFIGYSNPYVMVTAVTYRIGTPLAFLSIPGTFYMLQDKRRIGLCLALGAYVPLGIFTIFTLFASTASRYVFMSLPFWIILATIGLIELYKRAQTDRRTWLWILGIPIILYRDPAIKDIRYYLGLEPTFALFFILIMLVGLLGIIWFYRRQQNSKHRLALAWLSIFFFILLAHPIVTDSLYYAYQGGYRDDWKSAAALIRQEKNDADLVVTAIPPIVTYYLGEEAQSIKHIDLTTVLQNGKRVWFIEDFGLEQMTDNTFETWAEIHCDIAGNWDQYVFGRVWKMRVHRCDPVNPDGS